MCTYIKYIFKCAMYMPESTVLHYIYIYIYITILSDVNLLSGVSNYIIYIIINTVRNI